MGVCFDYRKCLRQWLAFEELLRSYQSSFDKILKEKKKKKNIERVRFPKSSADYPFHDPNQCFETHPIALNNECLTTREANLLKSAKTASPSDNYFLCHNMDNHI